MPDDLIAYGTSPSRKEFVLTGWHVATIAFVFFAVVAGVNGYMLRSALLTMPGLDARNGYDVSQRYNARIEAARQQEQLRWTADIAVRPAADGTRVTASLASADGRPVTGHVVDADLAHPAMRALDRRLPLVETSPGRYEGRLPDKLSGAWTLVIAARADEGADPVYMSRNRIALDR
ncbi:MAG: FixH family protein [Beijerinckiaceae bacterium]